MSNADVLASMYSGTFGNELDCNVHVSADLYSKGLNVVSTIKQVCGGSLCLAQPHVPEVHLLVDEKVGCVTISPTLATYHQKYMCSITCHSCIAQISVNGVCRVRKTAVSPLVVLMWKLYAKDSLL